MDPKDDLFDVQLPKEYFYTIICKCARTFVSLSVQTCLNLKVDEWLRSSTALGKPNSKIDSPHGNWAIQETAGKVAFGSGRFFHGTLIKCSPHREVGRNIQAHKSPGRTPPSSLNSHCELGHTFRRRKVHVRRTPPRRKVLRQLTGLKYLKSFTQHRGIIHLASPHIHIFIGNPNRDCILFPTIPANSVRKLSFAPQPGTPLK